jgi:hypothetical protein
LPDTGSYWAAPSHKVRHSHLTCRIAALCRVDRHIYPSDYHEAAILHVVERLERTGGKHHRPF